MMLIYMELVKHGENILCLDLHPIIYILLNGLN